MFKTVPEGILNVVVVVDDAWAEAPPKATNEEIIRPPATAEPRIRRPIRLESALFVWVVVVMGGDNT
jgi:hypothetical protein